MGQSFLTHDEKSSQSPSPDLLQFGGVSHRKFSGSLSSVKETTISSSSRSPLESTDSERNLHATSGSSSPRSPPQIITTDDSLYSSLIPTPIQPGNVHRLREKFMDFEINRKDSAVEERQNISTVRNESRDNKNETTTISELGRSFIHRPSTASSYVSVSRGSHRRGATLPSTPRSRSSLHMLSPSSRNALINRNRASLPTTSAAYEKLDVIRSDNDLSERFRQLTLGTSGNVITSFTSEIPLVRHRPRARPYVPQPRSVIIRAGYLPVVQTVDVISTRPNWTSTPSSFGAAADGGVTAAVTAGVIDSTPRRENDLLLQSSSNNESFNTPNNNNNSRIKEDLVPGPSSSTSKPTLEECDSTHVVTNQGDHTVEKKVLTKDAEVNTSAEVLVLPKGTKTSVLLKTALSDVVDGKAIGLKRRKKKRGITRRVARTFGRIMIRLVELF